MVCWLTQRLGVIRVQFRYCWVLSFRLKGDVVMYCYGDIVTIAFRELWFIQWDFFN